MKLDILFYFIIIFILSFNKEVFSQPFLKTYDIDLYQDNDTKVILTYKIIKESCKNGGINHSYLYKILGKTKSTDTYITWKINIEDCNGINKTLVRSISIGPDKKQSVGYNIQSSNYSFNSKSFIPQVYDVKKSSYYTQKDLKNIKNKITDYNISGPDIVKYNDEVSFHVDMKNSPISEKIKWYKNSCNGEFINTGSSIETKFLKNTTLFAGLYNNDKGKMECISKYVSVNKDSKNPTAIVGPSNVCEDYPLILKINDGFLGPNTDWVWYKDVCNGEVIGKGNTIRLKIKKTTKIYLKAEGENPTSKCLSTTVNVYDVKDFNISKELSLPKNVCKGNYIDLKVEGNTLSNFNGWIWYYSRGYSDKKKIGEGSSISYKPIRSGYYYLKADIECSEKIIKKSNYVELTEVASKYLSYKKTPSSNRIKVTLNPESANTSKYLWKIGDKTKTTKENTIRFKTKKSINVSVTEENLCGSKKYSKFIYTSRPTKKFTNYYSKTTINNKTIHLGLSTGLFISFMPHLIDRVLNTIQISGLSYELTFHPIIKNKFSLGFYTSVSHGLNFSSLSEHRDYNLKYRKYLFGAESAFGFDKFKILLKYEKIFEDVNVYETISYQNRNNYSQNYIDNLKAGFRIFSYTNNDYKRGNTLDLLFTMRNYSLIYFRKEYYGIDKIYTMFDYNFRYNSLMYGFEIEYWRQSAFTMNLSCNFINANKYYSDNKIYLKTSFLWDLNLFR